MKKKFDIQGMTCASCQINVENSVKKLGADKVNVSLLTNTMEVETDYLEDSQIEQAVANAGYKATSRNDNNESSKVKNPRDYYEEELKTMKSRLIVSLPLMIILMYVAMGTMINLPYPELLSSDSGAGIYAFLQFLLVIPVVFVNRIYFKSGFKSLFKGHPNMDTLVALGSTAAIVYGIFASIMIFYGLGTNDHAMVHQYRHDLYFEAGSMILTLITVGKYLEVKSKAKTTDAINKLMDLTVDEVRLVDGGLEEMVATDQVRLGQKIKILPGEKVGLDGTLVSGSSSIDTSAITGESMPVKVSKGDKVMSGSINNTGSFILEVTSVGKDTTISKIITLMEEASATKAPISKLADKISSIFVPIVIAISIVSFIGWLLMGYSFTFAFSIAIGILVISCPCALGLATPVAMMVANGKAAEHGILVKNAEALEILNKIDTIVLDKTGTITAGKPILTDMITVNDFDSHEALLLAASLEANSEHPLAKAILRRIEEKNIKVKPIDDFNSITGRGIQAKIEGKMYYIGNMSLVREKGLYDKEIQATYDKYASQGKTVVILFNDEKIIGLLAIADAIKNTSVDAIKSINEMGIETLMLTGDNELSAKEIAKQVGIDHVQAELLPQDKDKIISKLQENEKLVAMVGDGINDAPSLMRSDVGLAIADGTDIAIDSADLVLINSNLQDIVSSIKLSHATMKNIKQNLFWAFFYNVLAIPLAIGIFYPSFGLKLNPMIGALAMSLSSVFVVTNSLRLNKFKLESSNEKQEVMTQELNYDNINIDKTNENLDKIDKIKQDSHKSNNNIDERSKTKENDMRKLTLNIEGMTCMHCKMSVEKALNKITKDAEVSLEEKQAYVTIDENTNVDALKNAVAEAGYQVVSVQ